MAVKSNFASGDVLTSSDVNTYLTNGGLVYVTSQTVGTGVSSVTVSNAFNSTYDNYRIIYSGGVGSTAINLRMTFGSASTNYYGSILYCTYLAGTPLAIATNNSSSCTYVGGADGSFAHLSCDVFAPYLAKPTLVHSQYQDATAWGTSGYRLGDTSSYSSFSFACNTGTLTGGTVTVYGYRKA